MKNYGFSLIEQGRSYIDGMEKLVQSIYLIMTTPKGSRPRRPNYGSDLMKLVFDNIDDKDLMEERIKKHLLTDLKYERYMVVEDISVNVDVDNSLVEVKVIFYHKEDGAKVNSYYNISMAPVREVG